LLGRACNYKSVAVQEVLQEALKAACDGKCPPLRNSKEKRLLGQPQRSTGDYEF